MAGMAPSRSSSGAAGSATPGKSDVASLDDWLQRQRSLLAMEQKAEAEAVEPLRRDNIKRLEAAGLVVRRLAMEDGRTGMNGRFIVRFGRSAAATTPDDRPGDLTAVARSNEPEKTLATGVVTAVDGRTIRVAFEADTDDDGFADVQTANNLLLYKLSNTVTYRRMMLTLNLMTDPEWPGALNATRLYNKENLQQLTQSATPRPSDPELSFVNPGLNDSQRAAVRFALLSQGISLIHGPPGTGKTTTVVELIHQCVRQGLKVLVAAPSNMAIDNIALKLAQTKVQEHALDAVLERSDVAEVTQGIREDITQAVKGLQKGPRSARRGHAAELKTLRKELREYQHKGITQVLRAAQVVLGTTTTVSASGSLKHLPKEHFDVVIVDEAGQALEVACWSALIHARKMVLAGDHWQLPPTVTSKEAAKQGLAYTLLERVLSVCGGETVCMLDTQYRMHACIQGWSSSQFYESRLRADASVMGHTLAMLPNVQADELTEVPLHFVDTSGCSLYEAVGEDDLSKYNTAEAAIVVHHVQQLVELGVPPSEIGVITPYNMQVETIRGRLREAGLSSEIEVLSVDGFQGREKEAICISMVRSNPDCNIGFLSDFRRMNVAVTRARRHCFLVGDSRTISAETHLAALTDYLFEFASVSSAREFADLPGVDIVHQSQSAGVKAPSGRRDRSQIEASRGDPAAVSAAAAAADEAFLADVWPKVESYLGQHAVWQASTKLSSYERRLLHVACEQHGFATMSRDVGKVDPKTGTRAHRQLLIAKTQAALDLFLNPAPPPKLASDAQQATSIEQATASPSFEDSEDSLNESSVSSSPSVIDSDATPAQVKTTAPQTDAAVGRTNPAAKEDEDEPETDAQRVLRERAERLAAQRARTEESASLHAAGEGRAGNKATSRHTAASQSQSQGQGKGKSKSKSKNKGPKEAQSKNTSGKNTSGHRLGGSGRPAAPATELDDLVAAIEGDGDVTSVQRQHNPRTPAQRYIENGVLRAASGPQRSSTEQKRHSQLANKLQKSISVKQTERGKKPAAKK
ncbi:uncharacterized protein MONBRDRAFT_34351 [Monosiga brevicollis MX1]|uniref:DNA helicase n=1 Tax=Monosiga brevicollis TaxID=81824 RepID=A9VB41_MONBE|nr:uncharacterized protein MONBRDRAFT_34351 [Monosiga brevicollis MX1]EDQ85325.1 predicted protein [Monosiga brevicollis MX1]|eukprot:XP_001749946.1 hypothetical protein [Monosiga brevicollis MX1]